LEQLANNWEFVTLFTLLLSPFIPFRIGEASLKIGHTETRLIHSVCPCYSFVMQKPEVVSQTRIV
jgi:hypothetical protein